MSLSDDNQSDVIKALNSTSRYLDDLLNIDNNSFDCIVNRIYSSKLQLNKANVSDTDHPFGKLLFTWLSLVVSMVMSFCAVLFLTMCLGWDLELN